MKPSRTALFVCAAVASAMPALAQAPRQDVIWARKTTAAITLDGQLSEPAWAQAESMVVHWAQSAGIPGSGWKIEGGIAPEDPTNATLKLLVKDNQMYLGAKVRDKSIGGSRDFNRFDGFLMAVKDHMSTDAPKPPSEYFYVWWYPTQFDPQPQGQSPTFVGRWANWPPGTPRTQEQIDNWDAVTVVHGLSNSDATNDTDWTVEMRFNLTPMGYNVTRAQGDIVEWNISVYDCDWFWPVDALRLSSNRTWWQGPWGNAAWYGQVQVHARPDVTTSSGAVPTVLPELNVPNGVGYPAPAIDGVLNETSWQQLAGFDIRYGDPSVRPTYPGVGPSRAGQYQPEVYGGRAFVADPGDATVKMFYQGQYLYMAFDVRDEYVQYHPQFDRFDGFFVNMTDRVEIGPDNTLLGRRLAFQVGPNGAALPSDYLATLVQDGGASVAIHLNPGTTVDTLGLQQDNGWTAELKVDLTRLGYPVDLGDRTIFLGIDMMDGDSFIPFTDSYGTRTWWFREYESSCCGAWGYLAPNFLITGADEQPSSGSNGFALLGSYPNPGSSATIRFALPEAVRSKLEVFDVQGRLVDQRDLGMQSAGLATADWTGEGREAGVYLYRLTLVDPDTGALRSTLDGRLVLVR